MWRREVGAGVIWRETARAARTGLGGIFGVTEVRAGRTDGAGMGDAFGGQRVDGGGYTRFGTRGLAI